MYDIIGDIHGHADELEFLLKKLGYEKKNGFYSHPERKVVFVGDFIDRGPKIRESLRIVKNMVENETALATMGNHEYNALCYHTTGTNGNPLRENEGNNLKQHQATLDQFVGYPEEWREYLDWFMDLPLFHELDGIRVVHACWDQENIEVLTENLSFTREFLIELHSEEHYKKSSLYNAIDESLKGREDKMPEGTFFHDRHDKKRNEMRIKWYRDPKKSRYEDYYMEDIPELNGKNVDLKYVKKLSHYTENQTPVFCGHYWFRGDPRVEAKNIACVDYSVAKGGKLVAYRWDGEKELSNEKFVW
ncbi:MAG TPA: metallophosphoesterase [Ignavibacteria bacterium]|nr:metallophosphoesterase [Ignavibacteria bacterium]HMR41383.1 metallophosphoesterase [Ignavibacteria bacterium]